MNGLRTRIGLGALIGVSVLAAGCAGEYIVTSGPYGRLSIAKTPAGALEVQDSKRKSDRNDGTNGRRCGSWIWHARTDGQA